ncbi:MAG: hypothetical protein HUU23_12950 [Caldilineales bacterium]|nr:hypothetical protein [Caldilineales bacterium]
MPMSINRKSKVVAEILERAATDAAFRTLLLTNPAAALAGYSLTDEERAALSDRATLLDLLQ